MPHTGLLPDSMPTAVLTCGDPERAAQIAGYFEDAVCLARQREYHTYRGMYRGTPVAVCSHGIGAPGAAIAFEELIAAGARQLLRVGTCGSLQPHVRPGDLVVAVAAVQHTGYGREAAPPGYPAIADLNLTQALRQGVQAGGHPHHSGLVLTRDAFFAGTPTAYAPDYAALSAANVLAVEMECAALFLVGSLRRVATAAILAVNGSVLEKPEAMDTFAAFETVVATAVRAGIEAALATLVGIGDGRLTEHKI
ncbi:MAG: nucleoside phosphorylase [Chloroflexi bacterium]|nr:nucleoside phosphorylase [Chloroflexota bacterium]